MALLELGTYAEGWSRADLFAALSEVTLLRTDERGTLELIVEGEGMRMGSER